MSALGLLAHSVRLLSFCIIVQYMKLSSLLYASQGSKNVCLIEPDGVCSVVDYVPCVPIPVIKQDDPPPWVTEYLTTHPYQGLKTDGPTPLCSTRP